MIRRVAMILVLALVAAACSGGTESGGDGRLAIVDQDGDLAIHTAGGELVTTLTEPGGEATIFQPVWSGPESIVFVEEVDGAGSLVVAGIDGNERRRVDFATAPFYVYPRPGGDGSADIVILRNHLEGGLAAEVIHHDGSVTALEGGFPFFFTWTDDGSVVAHVESSSVDVVYPSPAPVVATPGAFGAPGSRGDELILVRSSGPIANLTLVAGDRSTDLATVRGPVHLVVGGDRVAVRSIAQGGTPGGIEARAQTIPTLRPDALAVVGLDDGTVEIVATEGVVAFFWDPDGRRLLYLVTGDDSELSWKVWEDGVVDDYASFVPDASWLATFLPFFDQYAQSMSLWSPDGSAFAFPGIVGGESGVWVQHLDQASPVRISLGSWVDWGPAG
jgi:hypothetical protein